jgi:hypothetical protein
MTDTSVVRGKSPLKALLPNAAPEEKGFAAVAAALEAEVNAAGKRAPRMVTERIKGPTFDDPHVPVPADYAPPEQRQDNATKVLGPLPDYVTHAPDVSRSAAIAAHAVVIGYEQCAQTLEQMGREYHDQAQTVLKTVIDTARLIRQKGAEAFREVEMSSKIGTQVTDTIKDLTARMNLSDRLVAEALENIDPPMIPLKTDKNTASE